MAIAVPIIMAASGASAAIAGALGIAGLTAGMVTAAAGVLTAATGIGAKINRAASKVFGEDLVSVANIAGGIALASGWDPASAFGSASSGAQGALAAAADGAAAAGAIDTAGAITQVDAMVDAAGNVIGQGGAIEAATGVGSQGAGLEAVRAAERASYSSAGGAAERMAVSSTGAAVDAGANANGALKIASQWWDKQPERVKAALVNVGGQTLAGAAQGWSHSQDQERALAERRRRERIFNAGSGLQGTYAPRAKVGG